MSLGGPKLREHVVEFIVGTGVITDGVVDATSTSGPWNWTVPESVVTITVEACSAGGGGGNGGTSGVARGGGGGGSSGLHMHDALFHVLPQSVLTISIGAGGLPTNAGGPTQISGLLRDTMGSTTTLGVVRLTGGGGGGNGSTTGGSGGIVQNGSSAASGGTSAASPGNGGLPTAGMATISPAIFGATIFFAGGSGGGGGSTSATVNGGAGGAGARGTSNSPQNTMLGYSGSQAAGSNDGTASYGGGGWGGWGTYGIPSIGGNGNVNAGNGTGFGFGGAGGGGNALGANGGDGYVKISYRSMD